MQHHLHKETHTIEEAAPVAGQAQRREGLVQKEERLVGNDATEAGVAGQNLGREFHEHP